MTAIVDPVRVPRTTLACVDCRVPLLGARALELSLRQCTYDAAFLFTDDTSIAGELDPRIALIEIPPTGSLAAYSRFLLKDLHRHVRTDFVQVIQWDGYVTNGAAWTDEFLEYDYIGARWPFRPEGRNVGNGGFSLRSRKLREALQDEEIRHSDGEPEDETACVVHRELLERRYGIRFAPSALADRYAFEMTPRTGNELGFHGLYNLPYFNDEAALAKLLDAVPGGQFASVNGVSVVRRLIGLDRKREALRYAKRVRAEEASFAALAVPFRRVFEGLLLNLVPLRAACPCGSGLAYERCCLSVGFEAGKS